MSTSNQTDQNWNQQIIQEFRANKGKPGGVFEGAPMLLLHTLGAKSGEDRQSLQPTSPRGSTGLS